MNINDLLREIEQEYDADVYIHVGGIYSPFETSIHRWCNEDNPQRRTNALLILSTLGGSPDIGFKVARYIQDGYQTISRGQEEAKGKFFIYLDGMCKSAGTLIAIGANSLIMTADAELGPLDVQLQKQDEVGERTSGLVPVQAFDSLQRQSIAHFREFFSNLRFDSGLGFSTKIAAGIATELTVGLLSPVYGQIDPVRVAEVERSFRIAAKYGERLSRAGNLKSGALGKLLAGYPSHGFVIDKNEATDLFKSVEEPKPCLEQLGRLFNHHARQSLDENEDPYSCPLHPLDEDNQEASHEEKPDEPNTGNPEPDTENNEEAHN